MGGTPDILKFLRSEFKNKPNGIEIDLFFGGGTDPYTELKKQGVLEAYRVPIVLNRLRFPEPKTWGDLARPELFSWVRSADPRKSGSVHMAYEIILQAHGWERG